MIDLENMPAPTAEQIAEARENAFNATHPASWTWNEELVTYVAPVSIPAPVVTATKKGKNSKK